MKEKIIYWSGDQYIENISINSNWDILYTEPVLLYSELIKNKNKNGKVRSFFECPGFKNLATKTFVFKNPIESSYKIENSKIKPLGIRPSIDAEIVRDESITNNLMFRYILPITFFSEEKTVMTVTSPYMHRTPYLQYGAVVPGNYDISSWFRAFNVEINLWENINFFKIEENEPLLYLNFETDKKIKFVRFNNNEILARINATCSNAGTWEPRVPLVKRYNRFIDSKTKELVIREIKKNTY